MKRSERRAPLQQAYLEKMKGELAEESKLMDERDAKLDATLDELNASLGEQPARSSKEEGVE